MSTSSQPANYSVDRQKIIKEILPAIRRNCDISNAQHSGHFSLCGLFLRMKDYYNWEHKKPPWASTVKDQLLTWIDLKENIWINSLGASLEPVKINGRFYNCLNNHKINKYLNPLGVYYGSGFGRGLQPTFFLGTIREKRKVSGFEVFFLGEDLACDISPSPALRQGRTIVIRMDPLRFFLWSKIQEMEEVEREGTDLALSYYGWDSSRPPDKQLEPIVISEMETILAHELGEAKDRTFPQGLWRSLLVQFPQSRIELYLRTLKDLLADTHRSGTLRYIIVEKKAGSLGFYLSNLKGLRRLLFPEIVSAIRAFKNQPCWPIIEEARKKGRERLVFLTGRIKALAESLSPTDLSPFTEQFEKEFYHPLGL